MLTVGTLCYLAALPLGWMSYRRYERKAAASATPEPRPADLPPPARDEAAGAAEKPATGKPAEPDAERPHRLN